MTFTTENGAGAPQPNAPDNWAQASRQYEVALSALHDGGEFGWKGRAQTCDAAMWRLFEMPSPDLKALARKLEIAFAPETDMAGMLDADAARALILLDVRRLAGG